MPKPISTDFRRCVVDAYLAGEGGYKKLASRFSLSWNSVRRWVYLEEISKVKVSDLVFIDETSTYLEMTRSHS